jgi:hypothetical protein
MLPISKPLWKPETSAWAGVLWAASWWWVWLVAMAVRIASPSAPPSCCEAFSSDAASPALSGGPGVGGGRDGHEHRGDAEADEQHPGEQV